MGLGDDPVEEERIRGIWGKEKQFISEPCPVPPPVKFQQCRLRALDNPDGLLVQIVCMWNDKQVNYQFDNWLDFGQRINNIIKELKETL